MAKVISLVVAASLILVAVGCGSNAKPVSSSHASGGGANSNGVAKSAGSNAGGGSAGAGHVSRRTEAAASTACPSGSSLDRNVCRDSYISCAGTAKAKVQAYTSGKGPAPNSVAKNYANSTYNSSGPSQSGYAGCMAALLDEYERLH
jgi:hypothetical protein